MTKIGFIGLGLMGKPMAINLLTGGFDVMVHSRSEPPIAEVVGQGASRAESLSDLARWSDAIITMLPTPQITEEVVLGATGIYASCRSGTLFIDMGTETPELAKRMYSEGKRRGIRALDAPVSGGDVGAREGTLSIMAGGDRDVFEDAVEIFGAMASSINYVGEAGAGQSVKAANQVIVAGILACVAEGLALLEGSDVDLDAAIQALAGGRAGSAILNAKARQMLDRSYEPGFRVELHLKDLAIVDSFARSSKIALPVTALTTQLLRAVEASGGGSLDHSAIIESIRALSHLSAPKKDKSS